MKILKKFKFGREMSLLAFIVFVILLIGLRNPVFLTLSSFRDVLNETAVLAIVAGGMMLVIVTGGIDLSVGSTLGLCGMVCALICRDNNDVPVFVLMLAGILCGLAVGAINGIFVVKFRVIPLIATLGTMNIGRASIYFISSGDWVSTHQMSSAYVSFASRQFLGISMLVYIMLVIYLMLYLFTTYFRTGRKIYAVGSNSHAAEVNGISVEKSKFLAYAILGALTGLGGMLYTSRYGFASFETGLGFEMSAITSCVLGGVTITGGSGKVGGVLLGAFLIAIINSALPMIQVSSFAKQTIEGLIILAAITVNVLLVRRANHQNLRRRKI